MQTVPWNATLAVGLAEPKFNPLMVTDSPSPRVVGKFGVTEKLTTGASNVRPMYDVPTRLLTVTGMLRVPVPGVTWHCTEEPEVHEVVPHDVSKPTWADGVSLLNPKLNPAMVTVLAELAAILKGPRKDTSGPSYVKTMLYVPTLAATVGEPCMNPISVVPAVGEHFIVVDDDHKVVVHEEAPMVMVGVGSGRPKFNPVMVTKIPVPPEAAAFSEWIRDSTGALNVKPSNLVPITALTVIPTSFFWPIEVMSTGTVL